MLIICMNRSDTELAFGLGLIAILALGNKVQQLERQVIYQHQQINYLQNTIVKVQEENMGFKRLIIEAAKRALKNMQKPSDNSFIQ